jgi:hypothetical protein
MSYQLKRTESFNVFLAKIFKKYPNSQNSIEFFLSNLCTSPHQGDVYAGFSAPGEITIRKVRIALKEYKISQKKGLRLIQGWVVRVILSGRKENRKEVS